VLAAYSVRKTDILGRRSPKYWAGLGDNFGLCGLANPVGWSCFLRSRWQSTRPFGKSAKYFVLATAFRPLSQKKATPFCHFFILFSLSFVAFFRILNAVLILFM
jgi:hypothetical protein